ncbi:MAG: type II 3-dehydroquinate dehydratase [Proteobacteria bacterium]|nr:type II 3-dehydroquinate dehydratase [Pseudomonadota bacterium]
MFSRKKQSLEKTFGLLNGPNLGRLGFGRSTEIYGPTTLADIEQSLKELAKSNDCQMICFQSQSEAKLIDYIFAHEKQVLGWIINPGALMMSGYSLADAIEDSYQIFVEVHLSKVFSREEKRHNSLISPYCYGQIIGFGPLVYELALLALIDATTNKKQ